MKHFMLLLLFQRLYDDIGVLQQLEMTTYERLLQNFSWEPAIIEKPVHHIKTVFTWSPLVIHLIVTRSHLFIVNLHFM